jgi:Trk-type K+ transport system membrane component
VTILQTILGLIAFICLLLISKWREKKRKLGQPALVPHVYVQFTAILAILVFAAHLIALVTGVEWQSPFRPSI